MNKTDIAKLEDAGFLGSAKLNVIFQPVDGVSGQERLERQGIEALGIAYASGYTKIEIAEYLGISLQTLYTYQNGLSENDKKWLESCDLVLCENLQKQVIRDVYKNMSKEKISKKRMGTYRYKNDSAKILLAALEKMIGRKEGVKELGKSGATYNTQIVISDGATWIPGLKNAITTE